MNDFKAPQTFLRDEALHDRIRDNRAAGVSVCCEAVINSLGLCGECGEPTGRYDAPSFTEHDEFCNTCGRQGSVTTDSHVCNECYDRLCLEDDGRDLKAIDAVIHDKHHRKPQRGCTLCVIEEQREQRQMEVNALLSTSRETPAAKAAGIAVAAFVGTIFMLLALLNEGDLKW